MQFHGCPECFPNRTNLLPRSTMTAQDTYDRTLARQRALEQKGYRVRAIWECEWTALMRDPDVKEFCDELNLHDPMDPREAFFGGN